MNIIIFILYLYLLYMHCAPQIEKEIQQGAGNRTNNKTCFTLGKLKKMADGYNNYYTGNKINHSGMSADAIWDSLRQKLSNKCGNNEVCWIRQDFVKKIGDKDLLNFTFKPPKPNGKYAWLSTTDIEDVMTQYEKVYPDFKFIGPVPIDFAEVMPDIILIDFAKIYKKGYTKIGVIFNTDPSYKNGEHWISMFINLSPTNPSISFYDSVAVCPAPSEIRNYIKYILTYTKKLQTLWKTNAEFKTNCNTVQHQRKNTECGVYSMYYIIESLKGKTFSTITNKIIKDEEMNKNRDKFFAPI